MNDRPVRRGSALAVVLLAALGACIANEARDAGPAVGAWVEVQGRLVDGRAVADEIEAIPRAASDTADKVALTAPLARRGAAGELELLGTPIELSDGTGFRGEDGASLEALPLEPGDWLKVKARVRSSGALRAREVRAAADQDRFEVEGELSEFDRAAGRLVVGTVPLALAQDARIEAQDGDATRAADPLQLFQADEQKSVPFSIRLADGLLAGGQVGLALDHDEDRDLDDARKRDATQFGVEAKLDLLWTFGPGSFALVEGKVARDRTWQEGNPGEDDTSAELTRAFGWFALCEDLRLQVGRHDFDEEREWLYDEILDGARVVAKAGALEFEAAAALGREFAASDGNPTEDTKTYVALARCFVDDDWWLTAYALAREDTAARDFEPLLLGLRSFARPYRGLGHWAELAMARGHAAGRDIDGRAFDVGVLYRLDGPLRPTIALGYAYGEGRDPGGASDGFRQSGLQDNNAKFGGVTSLKYYGEVFEPELANLGVTTLALGIRPTPSFSADLVLHTYRQDYLSASLFANDLRARPNGTHADLGWEADLVLGWRRERTMSAELTLGRFDPGAAFDQDDPAWQAEFTVRVKF
ncbi:MAG: alginate export family protein [Planctomycetes bacterium]|nr:alginate export family protein [Planctomycetota bacterium]